MKVRSVRFALAASAALATTTAFVSTASAAAPTGSHPRIWIGGTTLATIKANAAKANTAAASVLAQCDDVANNPSDYAQAGDQGYIWAYALGSCAMAYQIDGSAAHAASAVKLWNAMLDDWTTIGDGAGGDNVVQHDTGYAMRFFGAYSGLAYDWLHDAPGVTPTLRAHAIERFKAWTDWYTASGYLNNVPGSNYHAGYLFAKSIIAAASGGESADADGYWADVTTNMFPVQMVQNGMGTGGALLGGDMPEGWQYGSQSAMEYVLAARIVEDNGIPLPAMHTWADAMVTHFGYALTNDKTAMFAGGDVDNHEPEIGLTEATTPRLLVAGLVGQTSDETAGWAAKWRQTIANQPDQCAALDALAEVRMGAVTATDFTATTPATTYLAQGTRNLYTRSSWDSTAAWAVFTSAPRLVPDHQHFDASNFVLSRGSDHLIADPSPYGGMSTLTGNAITVDSSTVEEAYRPSQSPFAKGSLTYSKVTADGVVAARGDIAGSFAGSDGVSDVPFAKRDWVFLPSGEIVAIDRTRTGDATRKTYLRFRSPGVMTMSGATTTATVGQSKLAIHTVLLSAGTPATDHVTVADCWTFTVYGQCNTARFASDEYAVTIPGPTASAVHVLDALGSSDTPAVTTAVGGASDTTNSAVLGVQVDRGGTRSVVVSSSATDGVALSSLTYTVAGDAEATHVIFDAPADANGHAQVATAVVNGKCAVTITPGGTLDASPLTIRVDTAANNCTTSEEAVGEMGSSPTPGSDGGIAPSGSGSSGNGSGVTTGGGNANGGNAGTTSAASGTSGSNSGSSAPGGSASSSGGCNVGSNGGGSDTSLAFFVVGAAMIAARKKRSV